MGRIAGKGFTADEDTVVVLTGLAAVLIVLVAGAIGAATARDDSGMRQFFSGEAGGLGGMALRSSSAPESRSAAPPLTIRPERLHLIAMHQPKLRLRQVARKGPPAAVAASASPVWAQGAPAGLPKVVSLYEDRTLRRGDAVMTQKGIRIFAGSPTFPFRPEDFRNLTVARQINIPFRKALMELDHLPVSG